MNRIIAIAACSLIAGCAWRTQVEKSIISTVPVDFSKTYEVDRSVKISATDRAHGIWLIPLGSPDAQEAVDNTLKKVSGERKVVGLADANVKFKWLWLYLYSQRWYTVEGYPIFEKRQPQP